jgi:Tol biopolymer transport system component
MRFSLCAAAVLAASCGAALAASERPAAVGTLAVQGTAGGRTAIYVLRAGELTKLPSRGRFTGEPSWSPAGDRMTFTSDRAGGGPTFDEIFVMDADGTNVQQLTFNSFEEHDPAWAPHGDRIAFAGEQGVNLTFADGSVVSKITAEVPLRRPTWAPNGRKLAFSSGPNPRLKSSQVYLVNLNGTGLRKLTNAPGGAAEPDWSPNGKTIVFTAGKPADLFAMPSGGGKARRLTRTKGVESAPAWTADGRSLLFARGGAIWSMPATGGPQKLVLAKRGVTFARPDASPRG